MFWNHGDKYGDTITSKMGVPPECLSLQPERILLGMFEQGWYIRNKIIWHKVNHMPSSCHNRFTNAYEVVYMLSKNIKPLYYYNDKTGKMQYEKPLGTNGTEGIDWDWEVVGITFNVRVRDSDSVRFMQKATEEEKMYWGEGKLKKVSHWHSVSTWFDLYPVREPHKDISLERAKRGRSSHHKYTGLHEYGGGGSINKPRPNIKYLYRTGAISHREGMDGILAPLHPLGRNPGDVWSISIKGFHEAHFATFTPELVRRCMLVACPEFICKNCGLPRVRITRSETVPVSNSKPSRIGDQNRPPDERTDLPANRGYTRHYSLGWSDCGCNAGWRPGIVLDPFMGAGTTALVALQHNRNFIGIEINPKYIEMAYKRINPYMNARLWEWLND